MSGSTGTLYSVKRLSTASTLRLVSAIFGVIAICNVRMASAKVDTNSRQDGVDGMWLFLKNGRKKDRVLMGGRSMGGGLRI